jgi:hypothetical protein
MRARIFTSLLFTSSGVHTTSYIMGSGGFFAGDKAAGA